MPREFGGPPPEEMGIKMRDYKNPQTEQLVQRTLALAEQLGGNKLRPELVDAISQAIESGDPVAIDALDPDNERNKKDLSQPARDNLKRAWDALESKTDMPRNGIAA